MDKQLTILLPNDVPLELVLVEPGYFIMSSEELDGFNHERPECVVHITHSFYIGKYPVTQAQWQAVAGNNPSRHFSSQQPVESISWIDIVEGNQDNDGTPSFMSLINGYLKEKKSVLATTHEFRLPTEEQWEYAAKGGPYYSLAALAGGRLTDLYSVYPGSDRIESCSWIKQNSQRTPKLVGLKNPNEIGLYDMGGNVWEWCEDWPDGSIYSSRKEGIAINPVGYKYGGRRLIRGGSSLSEAAKCQISSRNYPGPRFRGADIGLRLVLSHL